MKNKNIILNSYFFLFLLVFLLFVLRFGIDVLNPVSTNWILSTHSDWGQHYLGWAYFREEEWTFPLGQIKNYNFPAGTTVGYTDSIPLFAYIFKLFNFLLPEDFQYLGAWLLISHLITAYFSIKIIELYSKNKILNILIALFLSFTPVIMYRDMHPALTAHWLIIAPIYYYIIINSSNFIKTSKKLLILVILASLINPYLLFLTILIAFASYVKLLFFYKEIQKKTIFINILFSIISVLITWILTGMISLKNNVNMEVINSYGLYSLNLNSFFNSESLSRVFPALPKVSNFQYEGYSYLGLGGMVLLLIAFILIFIAFKKETDIKKQLPLILLSILLLLFAISNKVTFNEKLIFNFYLPNIFIKLGSVFRATSRFVWVIYYVLFIFSFVVILKSKINKSLQKALIVLIFLTQAYDLSAFYNKNLSKGKYNLKNFNEHEWNYITSNFKKIITYKPFNNHLVNSMDYQDLCLIALKNKIPITVGYVARESSDINRNFLDSLNLEIKENNFSKDNLFIVSPNEIETFKSAIIQNKLEIKKLDSYYILFSKSKRLKIEENEINKQTIDKLKDKFLKEFKVRKIDKLNESRESINFNIEEVFQLENEIEINGWAYLKNSKHINDSIFVVLSNKKNKYLLNTSVKLRPDLVSHFSDKSLEKSGFVCKNFNSNFNPGSYDLFLGVKSNGRIQYINTNKTKLTIEKINKPLKIIKLPNLTNDIIFNIEKIETISNRSVLIQGWAGLENMDSFNNNIFIVLSGKENYMVNVNYFKREDVTTNLSKRFNKNYDNSGFKAVIKRQNINKGKYLIYLSITDENNKKHLIKSDKSILIN